MAGQIAAPSIEEAIRAYIQTCNEGDAQKIATCFCPDAAHYFPNLPRWSGASTIGRHFPKRVRELGYFWTVDQALVDPARHMGVLEWTQFQKKDRILRGIDWFIFEPASLQIKEIRTYVASPVQPELMRQELQDFDYSGRSHPRSRP